MTNKVSKNEVSGKCSRCKRERRESELNGVGYVNGKADYSKAYCRRLVDCNSLESKRVISRVKSASSHKN